MNKKRLLALFVISLLTSTAFANLVTVDAGHYEFTYDDTFWGVGALSKSGNTFTFHNLATNLGTSASMTSSLPYTDQSDVFDVHPPYWMPSIQIHADAGYSLKSIVTGATGTMYGGAGVNAGNYGGSAAAAYATIGTNWYKTNGGYHQSVGGRFANQTYLERRDPAGEISYLGGAPGSFNMSSATDFTSDVTALAGYFYASGSAHAEGIGSWAELSVDTAYFSVALIQTSPVPEPETWAMFMAGLGVVGMMARRRHSADMRPA